MFVKGILENPGGRGELSERAQTAVGQVIETLEQAIEERVERESVFAALSMPQAYSASTVAEYATSDINKEVDRLSGGLANSFSPRLFAQSIISQRAQGLEGALALDGDQVEAGVDSPDPESPNMPSQGEAPGESPGEEPATSAEKSPQEGKVVEDGISADAEVNEKADSSLLDALAWVISADKQGQEMQQAGGVTLRRPDPFLSGSFFTRDIFYTKA
jgi:hypothetical protein